MASNYPTSLDSFTNPSAGNTLDSPSHSLQHSDINDAVEALQTKVGIGDSPAGSATSGQVLTAQGGGTAIWATPDAGGLVLINTTSFSASSSESIDDVFSATYVRYLILGNYYGSATGQQKFQLRVAGSDATASDYAFTNIRSNTSSDTVTGNDRSSSTIYYAPTNITASYRAPFELWVTNPFIAENTFFKSFYTQIDGTHAYQGITAGNHKLNTSYTGFTIAPTTGTITGSISIFGINE